MKKTFAVVLALLLAILPVTACQKNTGKDLRLAGLKGPTSMGLVYITEETEANLGFSMDFNIYGSSDEITPKLIQGELDMATIPANLAAVLYNKTEGALQVLAINTLGVLYIVECANEVTVSDLSDLRGKTVYATGKGSTPEYTLRHLLTINGINPDSDVNLVFKSEPTEVVALLEADGGIAMLPQPYVTSAQANVNDIHVVIDLNAEWEKSAGTLVTGVLVARKDFVEKNPALVKYFLKKYEASIQRVNADFKTASVLIEHAGIIKATVAERALEACNLRFIGGKDMRNALSEYFVTLYNQNPASVGGTLPNEDFYYVESMD